MKKYIKCGFGITIGVLLAKGVWGTADELYTSAFIKNERARECLKKYFPNTYKETMKKYQ